MKIADDGLGQISGFISKDNNEASVEQKGGWVRPTVLITIKEMGLTEAH